MTFHETARDAILRELETAEAALKGAMVLVVVGILVWAAVQR